MKGKIESILKQRSIKDKLYLVSRIVTISFIVLAVAALVSLVIGKNYIGAAVVAVLTVVGIIFDRSVIKMLGNLLVEPIESLVVAAEKIAAGDFRSLCNG